MDIKPIAKLLVLKTQAKKETFIRSGRLAWAAGEEDLLAFYLSELDEDEQHAFVVPPDANAVFIDEGHWEKFMTSPQRHAQLRANEISYAWDRLIETFSRHILAGTQYYTSHHSVNNSERSIRLLARESRTRRRVLATYLTEVVREELPESGRRSRHVTPSCPGDPYYVFLLLWHPKTVSYEDFREVRRKLLEAYCMIIKTLYPDAEDIVGIATEDSIVRERSEDVMYLDARHWSESLQFEALRLKEELGILRNYETFERQWQEYPGSPMDSRPTLRNIKRLV